MKDKVMTVSEWKSEQKRQERMYYIKQKLSGAVFAAIGIFEFISECDITMLLCFFPLGLLLIFSKEKILMF